MSARFCGIDLAHQVINASGTFDAIAAERVFGGALHDRFPFAAFVSKTVTLAPRQGNPPPRLWELAGGMINSIGLPNKGLERFLAEDLPELAQLPVPLIVNVMGFTREEIAELVSAFEERAEVAAPELNVSCPNVETGLIMGADPGPLVRAIALAQVHAVAAAVEIPIVGMGGVQCGRDALDLMRAGAGLVAVGTENFRDPTAGSRIAAELEELLAAAAV